MNRPEGAHPAAHHSPQDESQDNGYRGEDKRGKKSTGSDECGQSEKRVEMEKNLHAPDVVFTREVCSEQ